MNTRFWLSAIVIVTEAWIHIHAAESSVDSIEPRHGSLNGETRITISGRNFARTHFNFGAGFGHLGNTIQMVSNRASYECRFHPDGTHESQITCYTPPNMPEDEYTVRVSVDGVDIPAENHCAGHSSRCIFKPSSSYTPTLDSLEPFTGLPGEMVKFRGKLITDRYGSNIAVSSNGKSEKLLRVYLGSHNCELKNLDNDTLFGIQLDNGGSSVMGNLNCRHESTYVSSINASFIIEGGYGRSMPNKNALRVSSTDKIYMFQTYAPITGISPSVGSQSGGTRLTITGKHFDETDTKVKVKIGDTDCNVVDKVTDTQIVCETAPDPNTSKPRYRGNRGLVLEIWNDTTTDLSDINSLSTSATDYSMSRVDISHYTEKAMDNYVTKMSGFFVAPKTSDYRFYVLGDDEAELYLSTDEDPANKVKICESKGHNTFFKSASQESAKLNLTEGQSYYMEVLHKEGSSTANVKVAARAYTTHFTNSMTGMAWQEKQKLTFSSTVVKEELNIVLTTTSSKTATKTLQQVVASGNTYEKFTLGVLGIYTEPMLVSTLASDVEKALNSLPVIHPDTVSVTATPQGSGNSYTITFNTDRGDIPDITYQLVNPNVTDLTVTVSKQTTGSPTLDLFSLDIDGIPSPGISTTASASDVRTALLAMFSARCPGYLGNPSDNKYFQDFETGVGSNLGERKSDVEPFCGHYSAKNPRQLYDKGGNDVLGVSLRQHGTLCFASLGRVKRITIRFSYEDSNREKHSASTTLSVPEPDDVTQWSYTCLDMSAAAQSHRPSGSDHRVDRLDISRYSSSDLYVDVVTIVRKPTTPDTANINQRRIRPATPNGALIRDVEVTSDEAGQFTVKLDPHNCGFDFPLMGVAYGKLTSGSLANTSSSAIFSVSNGGSSLQVEITRVKSASPPIGGSFTVSYQGQTTEAIPSGSTEEEVKDQLQSLSTLGNMKVEKNGNCANFEHVVTWLDQGGDLAEMSVDGSRLTGSSVVTSVETVTDGSLWYDPIVADMLRTHHSQPQVQVYINGIPSHCQTDCAYTWDSGATPTISSISPISGTEAQGTVVNITGTGFDSSEEKNLVSIAGVTCNVTSATATLITCSVGNGPTGSHNVKVNTLGKGQASGSVQFEYVSDITAISPTSGSIAGGTSLTISGYGFTTDGITSIGGTSCLTTTVTPGEIVCVTPQAMSTSGGTVSVTVSQAGANLTASTQFTYDASQSVTPVISSLSTTSSSVEGGSPIIITGTGFGASSNLSEPLTLGGRPLVISNYSDTQIEAILPSHRPGSYPLQLQVANLGYADLRTNSISNIDYTLNVTSVYPSQGSLYGGTKVTITGQGFVDNTTATEVKFGPLLCVPDFINSTYIECTIESTGKTHSVANTGTHTYYGYGYAWNPGSLEVKVGDTVTWSWTTPKFVPDIGYRIEELVNSSTTEAKPNGFSSGSTKSRNGRYQYKFGQAGNYPYWSGYADNFDTISLKGKVTVIPAPSHTQVLKLTVAGHEAAYNTGGSNPASDDQCPGTVDLIETCTDPEPADVDVSKFNFKFWSCASPVVTSINLQQGSSVDEIVVGGSGFSTTSCNNEVKIGDANVNIQSSTGTALRFKIDPLSSPVIGVPQELSIRVSNRGHSAIALLGDLSRRFVLLPVIQSVSPSSGSTAGGTMVTITGSGFQGTMSDVSVSFQGYQCVIQSLNYTQVVCSSPPGPAGDVMMSVTVRANGNVLPVSCNTCNYTYSTSLSPTVTDVTPSSVSTSSTTLNFTGTLFGTDSSGLTVAVGGAACSLLGEVTDTSFSCDIGDVPAGTHTVDVRVEGRGKAVTTSTVQSIANITSITPSSGSVHGDLDIMITGNGFLPGTTSVTIGSNNCTIITSTKTEIICKTPAGSGSVDVVVTSSGVTYPPETFTYSTDNTPLVTSVLPTNGIGGDNVTISGSGFSTANNTVTIGGSVCDIISSTTTSITCTLGDLSTGVYPIKVVVPGSGASDQTVYVTYSMDATGISPSTGGIAGGQALTVTGTGFVVQGTNATICGVDCPAAVNASQSATQFVCVTPPRLSVSGTESCDVVVTVNGIIDTLSSSYTYDAGLTSEITSVFPTRGGTGGGTTVTITGSGFGSEVNDVTVSIGGASCSVVNVTNTQITCITGASTSQKTKVVAEVSGNGMAKQTAADFEYIDVWSSRYTWGGFDPPVKGDLVVVPKGQILLLDTDTPVLKMLLIQGGELIFDEKNIELQAENILITDGGKLQVGTEAQPFKHKGIITMHGNFRSPELPIYGTKTLAVREGILDLHGKVTPVTWTRLAQTASAGTDTIVLQQPVNWEVDDEIVIATTGERHSQRENEIRTIASIGSDNVTLTLTSPLNYTHLGITRTYSGFNVDFRAEVGLLTHNVVVRGARDTQWDDTIEACPAGFDTGEFATQTCFLGRFGDEMGSDEFGASIMIHAPRKNEDLAIARISHVEVTHAGQAFRLGRYPIHFHLNGDMSSSYVRGCSIHHAFNRAVNVHGTHNTYVQFNVLYDVKGGAFFLEDGIETGNFIQYNLGVFVRASTSLLNDDITPATFWVTNPNNTVSHNAAAGGSHFGFWYRMHPHPEGPSFTKSVCCQHVPLGEFKNNTAHSFGWFGLWIFESYFPKVDASCSSSADDLAAKFESLTAWNCEKGAEAVNSGSLQFIDFILVNNVLAGYEGKLLAQVPQFDESNGPMVKGGIIVGHEPDLAPGDICTTGGIVLPYQNGFLVKNVTFENFNNTGCAAFQFTRITGTCSDRCGGFLYKTSQLYFTNTPNKVIFEWEHEGVIEDQDGTLTGSTGSSVIPTTPTLPPSKCEITAAFSVGINGSVCDSSVRFHRFAFNDVKPSSLEAKNVSFTNQHGVSIGEYRPKRITHKPGWVVVLVDGEDYTMEFVNAEHLTNISFNGLFYHFSSGQYMTMAQQAEKPDRFKVGGAVINETVGGFDPASDVTGSWMYDETNGRIKYLLSGNTGSRKKRGAISYSTDRAFKLEAFRCYYRKCITPPAPDSVVSRPENALPWSQNTSWEFRPGGKPGPNENVTIHRDYWLIADEEIPPIETLIIYGGLEFDNNATMTFNLHAKYIIIYGRLVIGWAHDPFPGLANIYLYGAHESPVYPVSDGPTLGAKFIAVYGGLDMHGLDPGVTWTRLASTASRGDNSLTLVEPVDWPVDSEILLTTTNYNAWATETFKITAVSGDNLTLTLNASLAHTHSVVTESLSNGQNYSLAARVALLTRNIKIIGADYDKLFGQSFGTRVIVARTAEGSESYSGFAKVQNVEFFHTGQEGYTEAYDPRFSLAFVDVSNDPSTSRSSYVRKNTFHNGFSRAIGAFGISDLLIEDNVIHHTVGPGIVSDSENTTLIRNLVTLSIWPGAYQDRAESFNIEFDGGIEAIKATNLFMRDNVVAGSERVGFHIAGEECSGRSAWSGNEVHSSMLGVAIFPTESAVSSTCVKWSNFIAWKNIDFGFYYNNAPSFEGDNLVSVENGVGVFPMVVGPSTVAHQTSDKYVHVKNSLLVGKTSVFDCNDDVVDGSDHNIAFSSQARSWGNGTHGKVGISWPSFTEGSNNAPEKPFKGIMAYQAISGVMFISNITFANFGASCSSSHDYAITTNPSNDDGQHPIESQSVTFINVNVGNKVFIHVPNVGKINSADCVDMDCDALKKAFIKDLDGSILGSPGAVLPLSEFEWDGDARRGLGDYRVPKVMQTASDGTRLSRSTFAPHLGIYRNEQCTYHHNWRAYECHDLDYEMLIIESMDSDTETRRLSPVAILGEGYLDLINGPQDHGWCSGYTCRKRVSTFQAIVATNKSFDIFFTSTTPQTTRYHLLNSNADQTVRLGVWYARPNRLDVYVNNNYVMPKNGETRNGRFFLRTDMTPTQFMPDPAVDPIGTNYVSREEKMLFFVVSGEAFVEIRTASVVVVSYTLPAMTVDEFFGEQLVSNLAAFLNVDPRKVRIVNVVNEQSVGRKKRSVTGTKVNVEIGDEPGDSTPMSYSDVQGIETSISNGVALGTMNVLPNGTVPLSVGLITATPPVGSSEWSQISVDDEPYTLTQAGRMGTHETPVPGREGMVFDTPVRLRVLDETGQPLSIVGSASAPWQVSASLTLGSGSHANATLQGTTTVSFSEGWANFTDLVITFPGSDYTITFTVISPSEAGNFTTTVSSLTVLARQVTAVMVSTTTDPLEGDPISLTLELRDQATGSAMSDISWRGHTWDVKASMSSGTPLGGSLNKTFDTTSGRVDFTDLTIQQIGRYYLTFHIVSSPSEYSFTVETYVDVTTASLRNLVVEKSSTCQFKFEATYDPVQSPKDAAEFANTWAIKNKDNGVRVTGSTAAPGSVIVTITFEGSATNVTEMISGLCRQVEDSSTKYTFGGVNMTMSPYMFVDGKSYYGNSCGAAKETTYNLHPGILAAIIVLSLIVVILVALIVIWKVKIVPKTKTTFDSFAHMKYLGNVDTPWQAEDILNRDSSFLNLKTQMMAPVAPADTQSTHALNNLNRFDLYNDRAITPTYGSKMPLPAD